MPSKTPPERNMFGELLAMLDEEELIRLHRRATLRGNQWLADILRDELVEKYPVTIAIQY